MFALILRYKSTVGTTPHGVLILHATHEPVLVGTTPLSKVLLRDYEVGVRFFTYDRSLHVRKEVLVRSKDYENFMKVAPVYYGYARLVLEQVSYVDDNKRQINIDDVAYALEEIKK